MLPGTSAGPLKRLLSLFEGSGNYEALTWKLICVYSTGVCQGGGAGCTSFKAKLSRRPKKG